VLLVFVQRRVAPSSLFVVERRGVMVLEIRLDPVVDTLPGDAEHTGEVGGGAPRVELQDGQGAPEEAGIQGLRELTPETLSLPRGEVQPAHVFLLDRRSFS
jgi:hypothetical protein